MINNNEHVLKIYSLQELNHILQNLHQNDTHTNNT